MTRAFLKRAGETGNRKVPLNAERSGVPPSPFRFPKKESSSDDTVVEFDTTAETRVTMYAMRALTLCALLVRGATGFALAPRVSRSVATKAEKINTMVDLDSPKVVTMDSVDPGKKKVYCRCWQSGTFPCVVAFSLSRAAGSATGPTRSTTRPPGTTSAPSSSPPPRPSRRTPHLSCFFSRMKKERLTRRWALHSYYCSVVHSSSVLIRSERACHYDGRSCDPSKRELAEESCRASVAAGFLQPRRRRDHAANSERKKIRAGTREESLGLATRMPENEGKAQRRCRTP